MRRLVVEAIALAGLVVGASGSSPAPSGVHLAIVVDTSGSMAEELPQIVSAIEALHDQLGPHDTLSLISANHAALVHLRAGPGDPHLAGVLQGLSADSGLDAHRALQTAQAELLAIDAPGPRQLLWIGDGAPNIGVMDRHTLTTTVSALPDIGLSVVALGDSRELVVLAHLARAGQGRFYRDLDALGIELERVRGDLRSS